MTKKESENDLDRTTGPQEEGPGAQESAQAAPPIQTADRNPASPSRQEGDETLSFEGFQLLPEVARAVEEMGYDAPMEVQSATFRAAMDGKNLVVQSRTGSGKTAAFGLPMVQGLVHPKESVPQALVLCPTRELARQVAEELSKLARYGGIQVVALYGGAPIEPQVKAIKSGAQVIVGTPGRVLDHIKRGNLPTETIRLLVLDECDEMLSMGFAKELQAILEFLPEDRQTLLFSATVTGDVERMLETLSSEPVRVSLSDDFVGVREVDHYYFLITEGPKHRDLLRILKHEEVQSAIVFCNTREETTVVASFLKQQGWKAEAISSDLTQKERERVMARMREGKIKFLVATDVAARGLDIEHVSHVINYSFPDSAESYVHRTGRTGRAGRKGTAISLVGPKELGAFYYMELTYGIRPVERRLPTEQELLSIREGQRLQMLVKEFGDDLDRDFASLVRRLWHSAKGEAVFSQLLRRHFESGRDRRKRQESGQSFRSRDRGDGTAGRQNREEHGRQDKGRDGRRRDGRGRNNGERDRGRSDQSPRHGVSPRTHSQSREKHVDDSVRLYVNLGRRDGVGAKEVRAFLLDVAGVEDDTIRALRVRDTYSYVHVDPSMADRIINEVHGGRFKDREVVVERARGR